MASAQLPQRPQQAYYSPHSATKSVDSSASSIFTANSPASSAATTPRSKSDDSMSSVLSNNSGGGGPAILDCLLQELAISEPIYLSELALLPQDDLLLKKIEKSHQRLNHNVSSLISWGPTVTSIYKQYIERFSYDTDLSPQILYLSRRPLIRLKLLSKVYKKIAENDPDNTKKIVLASTFQGLVSLARAKYESEKQRIAKDKIDFSLCLCLETHKPVSASFSISKVILRARFEASAKAQDANHIIQTFPAELLLLGNNPDSIEYEGLAICGLRPDSAIPYLVFPILRPGDVKFISDAKSLSLKFISNSSSSSSCEKNSSQVLMICHNPDQHSEWATKCRMLFSQSASTIQHKQQTSCEKLSLGLGIMDVIPQSNQAESIVPANNSSSNSSFLHGQFTSSRLWKSEAPPRTPLANISNQENVIPKKKQVVVVPVQEKEEKKKKPVLKRSPASKDISNSCTQESLNIDFGFAKESSFMDNPEIKAFMVDKKVNDKQDEWKKPLISRGTSAGVIKSTKDQDNKDKDKDTRINPVRSSSAPDVLERNDDYWATMSFINPTTTVDEEIRQAIEEKGKSRKKQSLSIAAKRVSGKPEKLLRSLLSTKTKKQSVIENDCLKEQEPEPEHEPVVNEISVEKDQQDKVSTNDQQDKVLTNDQGMNRLRNTHRPISIAVPQRPIVQEVVKQQQQQYNSSIVNQLAPIPEHNTSSCTEKNKISTPKSAPIIGYKGSSSLLSCGRSTIHKTIAIVSKWENGNWININGQDKVQSRINIMVDGDGGVVEVWPLQSNNNNDDDNNNNNQEGQEATLTFNINMQTIFTKGTQVDLNVRYRNKDNGKEETIMFRTRSGTESDQLLYSFNASRMIINNPSLTRSSSPIGFGMNNSLSPTTPSGLIQNSSFDSTCSSCSSFSSVSTCSSPTNSIRMSFTSLTNSSFYPLASDIKCKLLGRHHNARATNEWKVLGQCLLTLQLVASNIKTNKSQGQVDKRIIVRKYGLNGETLIDWILSPSAFERVGRVGISLHILKQETKPQAIQSSSKDGNGRHEVFMLQFKAERDAYMISNLIGNVKKK